MALDFLTKTSPEAEAGEKGRRLSTKNATDPENPGGRRLSRIGKPGDLSDTDSGLSVGAQIELEKENAIKYRTCGWKKVRDMPCGKHALF